MIDSVAIKRPTTTKSDTGGNKPTYSTVATTICRKLDMVMHPKFAMQMLADQLEPVKTTEFLLPYATDVRTDDQLVIGEGIFEVVSVESRSTLVQKRCLTMKAPA